LTRRKARRRDAANNRRMQQAALPMDKARWAFAIAIVAIGALVAATWSRYADDLGQARQRVATGSEIAQTPCGPIEYAVVGDGPPLLLVHGAGGGFDQGFGIAQALAARGVKVIVMSRFGYLRTPLPADASAAAQADAHACLLDTLNIERAAIAGVSAGAPSTLQFALRHPERTSALVLLVPAGRASDDDLVPAPQATEFLFDTALRSDFLFWAATKLARDTLIESILATPPALVRNASADEQRRVDAILTQILPVSTRRLGLVNDARVVSTLPRYPVERIGAPALLISVKDDGFGTWDNARRIAAQVPGARFVGYESGGHVWVGHHDELLHEVERFVKQAPP